MATIRPFRGIRPNVGYEVRIAALPYDVYSSKEAREKVKDNALSFLNIDRAETQFPEGTSPYDDKVYNKAKELFDTQCKEGYYIKDDVPCYYVYELVMNGRSQTGLVACASIDDYLNNIIKKHENTRADKEEDRIRHVDTMNAQTGPIFLAYRFSEVIEKPASKQSVPHLKTCRISILPTGITVAHPLLKSD